MNDHDGLTQAGVDADGDALALYALGVLPDDERIPLEARLSVEPDLRRRLTTFQESTWLLAESAEAVTPPPALRNRLLASVSAEPRPSARVELAAAAAATAAEPIRLDQRRRSSTALGWVAGIAAAVAVALSVTSLVLFEQNTRLRGEAASQQQLAAAVGNASAIVPVAPTGAGPAVRGSYLALRNGDGLLVLDQLPAAPSGQTYQLWFIDGQTPRPSVTFTPDAAGQVQLAVPPPGSAWGGIGITLEPLGGSRSPTLPVVAQGARS